MTAAGLALPAVIGGTTLANWQAGGFNKPQRSGFIRTCPDRSTGSKPLVVKTPDEVFQGRFHQGTLKRILKRISRVTISVSRLAYIEHKHRSHRFFQAIFFTRPSYGDDAKIARSVESSRLVDQTSRRAPALCPTGHTQSPGHFRPRQAARSFEFITHVPRPVSVTDPAAGLQPKFQQVFIIRSAIPSIPWRKSSW